MGLQSRCSQFAAKFEAHQGEDQHDKEQLLFRNPCRLASSTASNATIANKHHNVRRWKNREKYNKIGI
jgi:hypothetical protein